ncbi:MAG: putative transport-related rane protein [Flavipsychrobacter sp.]|jgi:SanA protein|nr:putative transport-related rane protein [Flavipsychrobacter sp.]
MFRGFWRRLFFSIVLLLVIIIAGINYMVNSSTKAQLYSDVDSIPKNKVGLLLGTAKYKDRSRQIINPYYQNRIDAAVALYMAGKIDFIIVSGDNSTTYYNEPALMKEDLIAKGVPANKIVMDNAGFRTLDSILRCRDIFGEDHITIISQEFHNQRALYIANHKNVTAVAFNAADGGSFWDTITREKLARVKMVLDLLFNKQAKYYGAKIEIK